jgi:guanylate kinase
MRCRLHSVKTRKPLTYRFAGRAGCGSIAGMTPSRTGMLLVVSGPSGSGKTTLCRRLADERQACYSVSCTTRAPRPGEEDGRDYHFLSRDEFDRRVAAGEFIEHAEVHGNGYGSLKSEVVARLAEGRDVVMDIDVQGAAQVRSCDDLRIRRAVVDVFVMPPGERELRERLAGRGTDSEETIALRMRNALEEMAHWRDYGYLLLSATREEDYSRLLAIVVAERMRVGRIG